MPDMNKLAGLYRQIAELSNDSTACQHVSRTAARTSGNRIGTEKKKKFDQTFYTNQGLADVTTMSPTGGRRTKSLAMKCRTKSKTWVFLAPRVPQRCQLRQGWMHRRPARRFAVPQSYGHGRLPQRGPSLLLQKQKRDQRRRKTILHLPQHDGKKTISGKASSF